MGKSTVFFGKIWENHLFFLGENDNITPLIMETSPHVQFIMGRIIQQ